MPQTVDAIYEEGVFRLCDPVAVAEGQRVTLTFDAVPSNKPEGVVWPALPPALQRHSDGCVVAIGTRISLYLLLDAHFRGLTPPQIHEKYPTVPLADMVAINAYIRQNELALRTHFEDQTRISDALRQAAPPGPTVEELRARWQQKFGTPSPLS
jgi:uncharacterized protein (DUF433 family)